MVTLIVTGVHSPLGRAVARWAVDAGWRVVGVDVRPGARPLPAIELVQTDIRNPLFARWLETQAATHVFHAAFQWRVPITPESFENNVVGTIKLLEAAAQTGVQKVVIPSSALVYGAHPQHPPLLTEDIPFRGPSLYGYVRDLREIELFVQGFRQRHPAMTLTVLRYANLLAPGYPSPLARYLRLPRCPVPAGANPFLSVLHPQDAVRAATLALVEAYDGVYNVAAQPPVPLRHLIHRAGSQALTLPVRLFQAQQGMVRLNFMRGIPPLPLPWVYLYHSWALSTRRLRSQWGFQPQWDTESILDTMRRTPSRP